MTMKASAQEALRAVEADAQKQEATEEAEAEDSVALNGFDAEKDKIRRERENVRREAELTAVRNKGAEEKAAKDHEFAMWKAMKDNEVQAKKDEEARRAVRDSTSCAYCSRRLRRSPPRPRRRRPRRRRRARRRSQPPSPSPTRSAG